MFELYGDANFINTEKDLYRAITAEDIQAQACKIFRRENCSELFYRAKQ